MKKILSIILTAAILTLLGCKSLQTAPTDGGLQELVNIMQGHYTSEQQSVRDTTYFNISLRMTPIWKQKGNYLFVEQAMATKQDKPYRVRIYKISQQKNLVVSEIYTIKNEKNWIGKWATPQAYDALPMTDIDLKKGCEVILDRVEKNKFIGKTGIQTCPSELRGASFASSIVTVTANRLDSWDQGFDKAGKQVWGAEKGGYEFIRVK